MLKLIDEKFIFYRVINHFVLFMTQFSDEDINNSATHIACDRMSTKLCPEIIQSF